MKALDSPGGHIAVVLFVFLVGVGLYVFQYADVGKEVITGSLASMWTMFRITWGSTNYKPAVVNQADTITVEAAKP